MLRALRKSSGQKTFAFSESKENGPFRCPECTREVVLRSGTVRMKHFAHKTPIVCAYGRGESDSHRRCKTEIYEALLREPGVTNIALERRMGTNRPDVSAYINGVPVAIEVQLSALSLETIIYRTKEYARKGIYVLWLPQWKSSLGSARYSPRLWEKWVHAAYFGQVYYWLGELQVARYRFHPCLKRTGAPRSGNPATDFRFHSRRYRTPKRDGTFNLVRFLPKERAAWESKRFKIPAAKLFMN
jgi:competence protein CoiA